MLSHIILSSSQPLGHKELPEKATDTCEPLIRVSQAFTQAHAILESYEHDPELLRVLVNMLLADQEPIPVGTPECVEITNEELDQFSERLDTMDY